MRLRAFYDNSVFLIYAEIRSIKNSCLLVVFSIKEYLKQLAIHKMNFKLLFFLTKYLFCKFLNPLVIQFTFFWQIRVEALKIIPVSQVLVNSWPHFHLFIEVKLFNLPFDIIYECIHRSWWKYTVNMNWKVIGIV